MAEKSLDTKVLNQPNRPLNNLTARVVKAGGVAKVAKAAGVSKGYVTHICAGRRSPSLDTLAALAVALKTGMGVIVVEVLEAQRKPNGIRTE